MLLGTTDRAPGGVLPYTVYPTAYTSQVPMPDMSMRAGPGRTYRFLQTAPTYPFHFGLTYTTFKLAWAAVPAQSQSTATLLAGLRFGVNITNTGERRGSKVVSAFVSYANMRDGPRKQLFGMERVTLDPGASTTVSMASDSLAGFCTFCSVPFYLWL